MSNIFYSETSKSRERREKENFFSKFCQGVGVDVGYSAGNPKNDKVTPEAEGIDFHSPGYDGLHLPFEDESLDYVYSSHVLEHIWNPTAFIREWFKKLKTGGHLIIVVPHQFLYEKRKETPSRFNSDHKRFYTPAKLLIEIESSLRPNSYRVDYVKDCDFGFDYSVTPPFHSSGEFQVECVLKKIQSPDWDLEDEVCWWLKPIKKGK